MYTHGLPDVYDQTVHIYMYICIRQTICTDMYWKYYVLVVSFFKSFSKFFVLTIQSFNSFAKLTTDVTHPFVHFFK